MVLVKTCVGFVLRVEVQCLCEGCVSWDVLLVVGAGL